MNQVKMDIQLPPGPRGLPVIGNALQMGGQDVRKLLDLRETYGDVVRMKVGKLNVYMLFNPDHVHHVLVKNQKNYVKGMGYDGLRLMLGQGLVTSDGEIWMQNRRLMGPFFTPTAVARYTEMMVTSIRAMLDRWQAVADSGKPVDLDEEMMRLTMSIIGLAMFSVDLGEELEEVGQALREAFAFIPSRTMAGGLLPLSLPLPSHRRFQHNMRVIDAFIAERIEQGRKQGGEDILSILLKAHDSETGYQLTERQLRDEVATLFFAGFETTARSLTWGWYLMSKHPEVAEKLAEEARRELKDGEAVDVSKLKYSRQVVDETLRIYPPTAMLARQNVEQDEIGGYIIPPGSMIVLVPYFVHRYPGIWDNPETFDPERFTGGGSHPKPAYIPFASGPRVCLGNSFALLEMVLTFSMASARYKLTRTGTEEIVEEFAGALRPNRTLWMRIENR